MRILYFSQGYTPHDRRFLQKMVATGHGVWFLSLTNGGEERRLLPSGVRRVRWPGGVLSGKALTLTDLVSRMPMFEALLTKIRPSLVHAGPVQSCGLMAALSGFHPLLVMSWGSDILREAERDADQRWITRFTLRHTDWIQCDCDSVRQKIGFLSAIRKERIIQFPWGVDLASFHPREGAAPLRRRLGWEDAFVVLSTRAWEDLYGIPILLEAFDRFHRRCPESRLILMGGGSLKNSVCEFIRRRGLGDVIFQPGWVPEQNLPNYFHASDAYISCSISDGSSLSLLQSMAMGVVPVVSDLPANREWVSPGTNGCLAPAGDPSAFAQALIHLSKSDQAERGLYRRKGLAIIQRRADWEKNFKRLASSYPRMVKASRKIESPRGSS